MNILIDDVNYHIENLQLEEKYISQIKDTLFKKYPKLNNIINKTLKDKKVNFTKEGLSAFLNKVILSTAKSIKDIHKDELTDDQFYKMLDKALIKNIPLIIENDAFFRSTRHYLYEPEIVYSLYILNSMFNATCKLNMQDIYKDVNSEILLINNVIRTLRSSITLFSIGDDVHGYALFRGIIELLGRVDLIKKFREDFVLFSKTNALLQYEKMDPKSIDKNQKRLIESFKSTYEINSNSQLEKFLLYGWIKNSKGKRITSATDMIKEAAFEEKDNLLKVYHFASEFIHEDYFGVNYDYVNLRINSKYIISQIVSILFELQKELGIKFSKFDMFVAKESK